MSLSAGAVVSAVIVVLVSLLTATFAAIPVGSERNWMTLLIVHGIAFISLLWVGNDAQRLAQRLNPDEYLLAIVYFYADVGVVVLVVLSVIVVIPLVCGGNGICCEIVGHICCMACYTDCCTCCRCP